MAPLLFSLQVDFTELAKQDAGVMVTPKLLLFVVFPVQFCATRLAGVIEKSHDCGQDSGSTPANVTSPAFPLAANELVDNEEMTGAEPQSETHSGDEPTAIAPLSFPLTRPRVAMPKTVPEGTLFPLLSAIPEWTDSARRSFSLFLPSTLIVLKLYDPTP